MEQSKLDLLPFLKEMEKLLNRTLPETIDIELHHDDFEYIISADPTRLQQVFMNLAVNARDAMPEGGRLRFELSLIRILPNTPAPITDIPPGNWILVAVSDTGIGIPVEEQSHIYEPFFTTKPVGQGTGLGLAQVYGIVKQHGGYIDLKSQVGEGTQFYIYLPSLVDAPEKSVPEQIPAQLDGEGKAVLLVEDDPATRKALDAMLSVHNYRVLAAENGVKALELLEAESDSVELVISDIVMPQMGGLDLYDHLQTRWPQIQVLLITGHPLDEQNQLTLRQGKVNWLQKPFTIQEFNQILLELLVV
jgi:CheY-like chemotaxis protein